MDMNVREYKIIPLTEIATIERANESVIYPDGCTLIPLSAADYKLIRFLNVPGHIDNRFAVVKPHKGINCRYVYICILQVAPKFFHTYQTGINLQMNILQTYFTIPYHGDLVLQTYIADLVENLETAIVKEERIITEVKIMKETMLAKMFV